MLRRARGVAIAGADDAVEQVLRIATRMHVDELRREVGIDRRRRGPQGDRSPVR